MVIITENCVERADGTLIGWDRAAQEYFALKKTNISADDVTKEEAQELLKLQTSGNGWGTLTRVPAPAPAPVPAPAPGA